MFHKKVRLYRTVKIGKIYLKRQLIFSPGAFQIAATLSENTVRVDSHGLMVISLSLSVRTCESGP
jgi:hypothetical protein